MQRPKTKRQAFVAFGIITTLAILGFVIGITIGSYLPDSYTHKAWAVVVNPTNTGSTTYLNKSHLIGLQDSQTCINLIKNNIPSNCITYDQVLPLDNTNPHISGKWLTKPYFHRDAPQIPNGYNFYNNDFVVMVDPDSKFTTQAKMIIMQSDNFTYINPDEVITNHTRTEYIDRFVANCELATVAPNVNLIADTILYLESGCTKTNYPNLIIHKPTGNTPVDTRTLQVSQARAYGKMAGNDVCVNGSCTHTATSFMQNCLTKKCVTPKNPLAKW